MEGIDLVARSGTSSAVEFEESICLELSARENFCHCPLKTPFIIARCIKERGEFVYKYRCSLCALDATIRVNANCQLKEACRHPPKLHPGWIDARYRVSKDPEEAEYSLPKDPHLESSPFRLDGRRLLPVSPFKAFNGKAFLAAGPIMTVCRRYTGARFAPYVREGRITSSPGEHSEKVS